MTDNIKKFEIKIIEPKIFESEECVIEHDGLTKKFEAPAHDYHREIVL